MAEDDRSEQETQQTPTGYTIPVPSREDVYRDLAKVAKPSRKPSLRKRLRRSKEQ